MKNWRRSNRNSTFEKRCGLCPHEPQRMNSEKGKIKLRMKNEE
jgi:hypothetical protein